MTDTLKLPDGSVVSPDDVFLYNDYPYRYVPVDGDGVESETGGDHPPGETPAFYLSPLYWGGGEMDVPFDDREALADQWEPSESGVLGPDEWASWLADARGDDRFDEAELDAVARELPGGDPPGLLDRLRRFVG